MVWNVCGSSISILLISSLWMCGCRESAESKPPRLIHQKYPRIKIIMLTIYDDDQYVTEAIQAGANGYVLKKVQRDELIQDHSSGDGKSSLFGPFGDG